VVADGKSIALISDRSGREEVWVSIELGKNAKQISDADCDKNAILWAPTQVALVDRIGSHAPACDAGRGETTELASSNTGPIGTTQFFTDGK